MENSNNDNNNKKNSKIIRMYKTNDAQCYCSPLTAQTIPVQRPLASCPPGLYTGVYMAYGIEYSLPSLGQMSWLCLLTTSCTPRQLA